MSTRYEVAALLDVRIPTAYKVISGNASGTTPKVSAWIKLGNVDTAVFLFVTGSTTNVTWTARVATNSRGSDAIALPNPPTFPTGTNQNATATITMPKNTAALTAYEWLELTGTPSAGAGAVEASPQAITGNGRRVDKCKLVDFQFYTPAADNLAGTPTIDVSANSNPEQAFSSIPNNVEDPAVWAPILDVANTAITFAAIAGSGGNYQRRAGLIGAGAVRSKITLTAGFGRFTCWLQAKG